MLATWGPLLARNGFVLVLPVLLWNAVFWPRLPAQAGGTGSVPQVLKLLEGVLRAAVFVSPLFLWIAASGSTRNRGGAIYLAGLLIYFWSWLPWLKGRERRNLVVLLGPYSTPLIIFGGIAVLCASWPYFALATAFVGAHVWAGLLKSELI